MPKLYESRYRIVTMDVWGNPVDGWDVNNWFRHGAPVLRVFSTDPDGPRREDVLRALRKAGHVKPGIRAASLGWDGFDPDIYVTDERCPRLPATYDGHKVPDYGHGKPVYNLECVAREDWGVSE